MYTNYLDTYCSHFTLRVYYNIYCRPKSNQEYELHFYRYSSADYTACQKNVLPTFRLIFKKPKFT